MILVGCPVSRREWILDRWFEAAERALTGLDHAYSFVSSRDDTADHALINARQDTTLVLIDEPQREDVRDWDKTSRLHHMVVVRNTLLAAARHQAPDFFLSCDSDILLHPDSVRRMLKVYSDHDRAWAVGSKAYMTPRGKSHPNYGLWLPGQQNFSRPDSEGVSKVGILMAVKMMDHRAYGVDYQFHPKGEDLGWSQAVTQAGGHMWWDGGVLNRHVMSPSYLEET